MRKHWKIFGVILVLLASAGTVICAVFLVTLSSPSDETLLRRFPAVRPNLEEVLKLVPIEGQFVRIAPSRSEPNFPNALLTKIRALLEGAGISEGLLIRDGVYLFLVDAHGMVGRGWTKGFAYSSAAPVATSIRDVLNAPRALPIDGLFLRPISDAQGWYIFVDR